MVNMTAQLQKQDYDPSELACCEMMQCTCLGIRDVNYHQGRIQRGVRGVTSPSPQILSTKLCPSAKWWRGLFFFFLLVTNLAQPFLRRLLWYFFTFVVTFVYEMLFLFFFCHFSPRKFSGGQPFGKICKEKMKGRCRQLNVPSANWDSRTPHSHTPSPPPPSRKVLATPLTIIR